MNGGLPTPGDVSGENASNLAIGILAARSYGIERLGFSNNQKKSKELSGSALMSDRL